MKFSASTLILAVEFVLSVAAVRCANAQSTWTATASSLTGNWSSTTTPGWTIGGVPNAIGATGQYLQNNPETTNQDIAAGVTVGTLLKNSAVNSTIWTFTLANALTFNQDGTGAGTATISNNTTAATAGANGLDFSGAGGIKLADDLLVTNLTTNTNRAAGSINLNTVISGTGNVTFSNAVASTTNGQIRLQGINTFVGNVLVAKGGLAFSKATAFGDGANAVTLGQSSQGTVNVEATASGLNVANPITVAGSTGGTTTVLYTGGAGTSESTYSGNITLNGGLTFSDNHTLGRGTILSGTVSGADVLTTTGSGLVRLTAAGGNSYSGGTVVNGGTLLVNNSTGSGTGTGAVTVNNAGTVLGGNGTISGAVTVGDGTNNSILSPGGTPYTGAVASGPVVAGNGVATLRTGALTLAANSTFAVDLNSNVAGTGYDQVSVTGTVTLSGGLTVSLGTGFTPASSDVFFIVVNDGVDPVLGAFASAPAGYTVDYFADSGTGALTGGNDVALIPVPVPEPSTVFGGLLLAGVAATTWRRRARLFDAPRCRPEIG